MEKIPAQSPDQTVVDLGEDLLESNTGIAESIAVLPPPRPTISDDEYQKGEILMGERLLEDAKKIFRKILRINPHHKKAKECLDEIQKQEIQELLTSQPKRHKIHLQETTQDLLSTTEVIENLEQALHIHLDKLEGGPSISFFLTEEDCLSFSKDVIKKLESLPQREHIDLGIAFYEFGIPEVSVKIFENLIKNPEYKAVGMYLLGLSLIAQGKAIEATIRLEPLARDLTLSETQKIDFLYLMGLAFEKLNDAKKAKEFYRRAYLLNPKYRDLGEKINRA